MGGRHQRCRKRHHHPQASSAASVALPPISRTCAHVSCSWRDSMRTHCAAGTVHRSAYPPPSSSAATGVPTGSEAHPERSTTPAASTPSTGDAPAGTGYCPRRCSRSSRLTPEACTRSVTWSGGGGGRGAAARATRNDASVSVVSCPTPTTRSSTSTGGQHVAQRGGRGGARSGRGGARSSPHLGTRAPRSDAAGPRQPRRQSRLHAPGTPGAAPAGWHAERAVERDVDERRRAVSWRATPHVLPARVFHLSVRCTAQRYYNIRRIHRCIAASLH